MNALPYILGIDEWKKRAAQTRHEAQPCNTWLYFIEAGCGGPIKIGVANDPWDRLSTFQTSHFEDLRLLAVCYSSQFEERLIHRELDGDRIRGEWFQPSERLYRAIKAIQAWNIDDAIAVFPHKFDPRAVHQYEAAAEAIIAAAPPEDDE